MIRPIQTTIGVLAVVLALVAEPGEARVPRQGLGPYEMTVPNGQFQVKLLRREGDTLWILREMQTGNFIETAVAFKDVQHVAFPRPRFFQAAEQLESNDQIEPLLATFRRFISSMLPFRDVPGSTVDEALYLQGLLLEKKEDWQGALDAYNDLLAQDYDTGNKDTARYRAGLCHARLGNHEDALSLLQSVEGLEDNLALKSEVFFARAEAHQALEQYEEAAMAYVHLLVFQPYVNDNELRCLAAVLPCYASMEDWQALSRTFRALKELYPDTEEYKQAERLIETYQEQLKKEQQFAGIQEPAVETETADREQ